MGVQERCSLLPGSPEKAHKIMRSSVGMPRANSVRNSVLSIIDDEAVPPLQIPTKPARAIRRSCSPNNATSSSSKPSLPEVWRFWCCRSFAAAKSLPEVRGLCRVQLSLRPAGHVRRPATLSCILPNPETILQFHLIAVVTDACGGINSPNHSAHHRFLTSRAMAVTQHPQMLTAGARQHHSFGMNPGMRFNVSIGTSSALIAL